jgi:hypothetical protein
VPEINQNSDSGFALKSFACFVGGLLLMIMFAATSEKG